jgi:plasmid replication initiation protein
MGSAEIALIPNNKTLLKKHTSAIHSSGKLSLLQRKISNSLLYYAFDNLLVTEEHEITVGELCKLIGYAGNNYQVIKQAFKGLISTVIEWNVLDEKTKEEDWSASSILASVRIKGARCYYAYSPRMRELLSTPSMYAKINLYIQSKFHSSYGLALYENCIRYRSLQSTKWFQLSQFRKLMGVEEGNYKIFKDFKKRVIDKAIDEVNAYSDINISVVYKKMGRKVDKLRFLLQERPKKIRLGCATQTKDQQSELSREVQTTFGVSALQTEKLIVQYEEDYLLEKINYVKATKTFKNKESFTGSLAAYFIAALRNDYKSAALQGATTRKAHEQEKREENTTIEKYKHFCREQGEKIFDRLDPEIRQKILDAFEKHIKSTVHYVFFLEQQLAHPVIKDLFCDFLQSVKQIKSELLSIDEYRTIQADVK